MDGEVDRGLKKRQLVEVSKMVEEQFSAGLSEEVEQVSMDKMQVIEMMKERSSLGNEEVVMTTRVEQEEVFKAKGRVTTGQLSFAMTHEAEQVSNDKKRGVEVSEMVVEQWSQGKEIVMTRVEQAVQEEVFEAKGMVTTGQLSVTTTHEAEQVSFDKKQGVEVHEMVVERWSQREEEVAMTRVEQAVQEEVFEAKGMVTTGQLSVTTTHEAEQVSFDKKQGVEVHEMVVERWSQREEEVVMTRVEQAVQEEVFEKKGMVTTGQLSVTTTHEAEQVSLDKKQGVEVSEMVVERWSSLQKEDVLEITERIIMDQWLLENKAKESDKSKDRVTNFNGNIIWETRERCEALLEYEKAVRKFLAHTTHCSKCVKKVDKKTTMSILFAFWFIVQYVHQLFISVVNNGGHLLTRTWRSVLEQSYFKVLVAIIMKAYDKSVVSILRPIRTIRLLIMKAYDESVVSVLRLIRKIRLVVFQETRTVLLTVYITRMWSSVRDVTIKTFIVVTQMVNRFYSHVMVRRLFFFGVISVLLCLSVNQGFDIVALMNTKENLFAKVQTYYYWFSTDQLNITNVVNIDVSAGQISNGSVDSNKVNVQGKDVERLLKIWINYAITLVQKGLIERVYLITGISALFFVFFSVYNETIARLGLRTVIHVTTRVRTEILRVWSIIKLEKVLNVKVLGQATKKLLIKLWVVVTRSRRLFLFAVVSVLLCLSGAQFMVNQEYHIAVTRKANFIVTQTYNYWFSTAQLNGANKADDHVVLIKEQVVPMVDVQEKEHDGLLKPWIVRKEDGTKSKKEVVADLVIGTQDYVVAEKEDRKQTTKQLDGKVVTKHTEDHVLTEQSDSVADKRLDSKKVVKYVEDHVVFMQEDSKATAKLLDGKVVTKHEKDHVVVGKEDHKAATIQLDGKVVTKHAEDHLVIEQEDSKFDKRLDGKKVAKYVEDHVVTKQEDSKVAAKLFDGKVVTKHEKVHVVVGKEDGKAATKQLDDKVVAKHVEDHVVIEQEDSKSEKRLDGKKVTKHVDDHLVTKQEDSKVAIKQLDGKVVTKHAEDHVVIEQEYSKTNKQLEGKVVTKHEREQMVAEQEDGKAATKQLDVKDVTKHAKDHVVTMQEDSKTTTKKLDGKVVIKHEKDHVVVEKEDGKTTLKRLDGKVVVTEKEEGDLVTNKRGYNALVENVGLIRTRISHVTTQVLNRHIRTWSTIKQTYHIVFTRKNDGVVVQEKDVETWINYTAALVQKGLIERVYLITHITILFSVFFFVYIASTKLRGTRVNGDGVTRGSFFVARIIVVSAGVFSRVIMNIPRRTLFVVYTKVFTMKEYVVRNIRKNKEVVVTPPNKELLKPARKEDDTKEDTKQVGNEGNNELVNNIEKSEGLRRAWITYLTTLVLHGHIRTWSTIKQIYQKVFTRNVVIRPQNVCDAVYGDGRAGVITQIKYMISEVVKLHKWFVVEQVYHRVFRWTAQTVVGAKLLFGSWIMTHVTTRVQTELLRIWSAIKLEKVLNVEVLGQATKKLLHWLSHLVSKEEILKSIVYGGLTEIIASISIVAFFADFDTTILNVIAFALAGLIGGCFFFVANIWGLKKGGGDMYREQLGRVNYFPFHATLAMLSFIIFGMIPPSTFVFSFLKTNDKKIAIWVVSAISLLCLSLLAIFKAYVTSITCRFKYAKTVIWYQLIAMGVSICSYLASKMVKGSIEDLGLFDTSTCHAMSSRPN